LRYGQTGAPKVAVMSPLGVVAVHEPMMNEPPASIVTEPPVTV
jgi:hypothetical protein